MSKILLGPFILLFVFALSCDNSEETIPSGICRLKKIVFEDGGQETVFQYNDKGLLIGYNLPAGRTCKASLEYDDQGRLIRRTESCGDVNEVVYTYLTPLTLEGKLTNYDGGIAKTIATIHLYYNASYQIDSTIVFYSDRTVKSSFHYIDGNLESSIQTEDPCCWTYRFSGASYDTGINPYLLLKQASNNLGLESIAHLTPGGIFIASINNKIEHQMLWTQRLSSSDPRIISEETKIHKATYEYYEGSQYVKRIKESPQHTTGLLFVYEKCQ